MKKNPLRDSEIPIVLEDFLLKKFNIPIVVNSDAHRPELVNAGRMEALEALQEMGFRTVGELHAGKWVEMPLEGMGCNF